MPFNSNLCAATALIFAGLVCQAGEVLKLPEGQMLSESIRTQAMPDTGESRIGKILKRFYEKGLGGSENWASIISMRSSGTITLETGETIAMEAYQRKPDRTKIILRGKGFGSVILSYDGKLAWKQPPGTAPSTPMDAEESRRFIHSSQFGNYLLYPFAEGKKIEYIETIPIDQTVCHKVRVHLDTGYQVDYYIDVSNYHELRVDNLDLQSGLLNSVRYYDYAVVSGMPMAMRVENLELGKLLSVLELSDFKVNIGIMPWMFEMPPAL